MLRPGDILEMQVHLPIRLAPYININPFVALRRTLGADVDADVADMKQTVRQLYWESAQQHLRLYKKLHGTNLDDTDADTLARFKAVVAENMVVNAEKIR